MRVRWTERASKDTLGIFDYIANQSPTYAESVYERILTRPSQLERFPESGSIVPEYDRPDIRELFRSAWRSLEQQLRQSGDFQAAAPMVLHTWNQRQEHHPPCVATHARH